MQLTRSPSKLKAIEFVKMPDGAEMQFEIVGSEAQANKFIQAMRVELSRMRKAVRERNMAVKPITMRTKSIVYDADKNRTTVILLKDAGHAELAQEVQEVMSCLTTGSKIDAN